MQESFVGKPKQQYVKDIDNNYCNTSTDKSCDDLCAKYGYIGKDEVSSVGTGTCKGKNDCFCDGYFAPSVPQPPAPMPNQI